jgi:predicted nucleic acid-binding protein
MSQSYVLDTSALLNLIRGGDLGKSIERAFGLRAAFHRHIVSIVSHAELRALAERNQWGDRKLGSLTLALNELVTVNVDSSSIVDAYVRIEENCRNVPTGDWNMGQNDMWIAATAIHVGLPLITTDKDFNHLDGRLVQVHWIDPKGSSETKQ